MNRHRIHGRGSKPSCRDQHLFTRRGVVKEERAVAPTSGCVLGFGIAANLNAQPRQGAAHCLGIYASSDPGLGVGGIGDPARLDAPADRTPGSTIAVGLASPPPPAVGGAAVGSGGGVAVAAPGAAPLTLRSPGADRPETLAGNGVPSTPIAGAGPVAVLVSPSLVYETAGPVVGETCTGTQSPFHLLAWASAMTACSAAFVRFLYPRQKHPQPLPQSPSVHKVRAVEPADCKNRITRCKSGVRVTFQARRRMKVNPPVSDIP